VCSGLGLWTSQHIFPGGEKKAKTSREAGLFVNTPWVPCQHFPLPETENKAEDEMGSQAAV